MKAIKSIVLISVLSLAFAIAANAQERRVDGRTDNKADSREGWNQGRAAIVSIGIGGTRPIGINSGNAFLMRPGLSTNFAVEFRVHRFIGVGFQTGVNAFFE